jgi:hypothetical protein
VCEENARFTNEIAQFLPVCHVFMNRLSYDFKPDNLLQYVEEKMFHRGYVAPDTATFSSASKVTDSYKLTIDAVNPEFLNHHVCVKHMQGAYSEPYLAEFMESKKWTTPLISGLYLKACVLNTLEGAKRENLTPVLVVDRVLGFGNFDFTKDSLKQESKEEAIQLAQSLGIRFIEGNKLLDILKS